MFYQIYGSNANVNRVHQVLRNNTATKTYGKPTSFKTLLDGKLVESASTKAYVPNYMVSDVNELCKQEQCHISIQA